MGQAGKRLVARLNRSGMWMYKIHTLAWVLSGVQQAGGALTCLHLTGARGLRFYKRIRLPAWHVRCQKGTLSPLPHTVALRVSDKNFPYFFMEVVWLMR
jgi:hypothetical protein